MVRIVRELEERGVLLLSTGTLAAAAEYAPYEGTRAFFEAVGFLHVDTIDPYPGRDAGNPCALLVMPIRRGRPA